MVDQLKEYTLWLASLVLAGMILAGTVNWLLEAGKNDSDPPQHGARSGLRTHVDSLTGCQYLSTYKGGLVKRKDTDGNQVGCQWSK